MGLVPNLKHPAANARLLNAAAASLSHPHRRPLSSSTSQLLLRLRLRRVLNDAIIAHGLAEPSPPGSPPSGGGSARTLYTSSANVGSGSPTQPGSHQFFDPAIPLPPGDAAFGGSGAGPKGEVPFFGQARSPSSGGSSSASRNALTITGDPSSSSSSSSSSASSSPNTNIAARTGTSSDPPLLSTSSGVPIPPPSTNLSPLRGSSASPFPSYFGSPAAFKTPGRGSFVFHNGASGIPKTGHEGVGAGGAGGSGGGGREKAKGKARLEDDAGASGSAVGAVEGGTGAVAETTLSVQVGEDAYFLRGDSLGVADGVGGWRSHPGANPALFSKKLMHHCSHELARYEDVDDSRFLSYYDVDPVEVLQRAYERCLQEAREEGIIGSSTALLAVLRNDELRIANVGDCCCSIIRGTDYIFRSDEQQHSFNYPVQVGTNSKDTPEKDAQKFTVKVQKNDIVILSSDGLVDNLFDEDILEEVLRFTGVPMPEEPHHDYSLHPSPPSSTASSTSTESSFSSFSRSSFASAFSLASTSTSSTSPPSSSSPASNSRLTLNKFSPQAVSEALCSRAKAVSEDQHAVTSPFAQRAMDEGIHFVGGKNDDISVLVAVVGDQEDSPDRR